MKKVVSKKEINSNIKLSLIGIFGFCFLLLLAVAFGIYEACPLAVGGILLLFVDNRYWHLKKALIYRDEYEDAAIELNK